MHQLDAAHVIDAKAREDVRPARASVRVRDVSAVDDVRVCRRTRREDDEHQGRRRVPGLRGAHASGPLPPRVGTDVGRVLRGPSPRPDRDAQEQRRERHQHEDVAPDLVAPLVGEAHRRRRPRADRARRRPRGRDGEPRERAVDEEGGPVQRARLPPVVLREREAAADDDDARLRAARRGRCAGARRPSPRRRVRRDRRGRAGGHRSTRAAPARLVFAKASPLVTSRSEAAAAPAGETCRSDRVKNVATRGGWASAPPATRLAVTG